MKYIIHILSIIVLITIVESAVRSNLKNELLAMVNSPDFRELKREMRPKGRKNFQSSKFRAMPYIHERDKTWRAESGSNELPIKNNMPFTSPQHEDNANILRASNFQDFKNLLNAKLTELIKQRKPASNLQKIGVLPPSIPQRDILRRGPAETDEGSEAEESSSGEIQSWKEDWTERWMLKKLEALNSTAPQGDTVNMAMARPWGIPCGDAAQHDVPWGSCMLGSECDPEYRVYRGDLFCGRTEFVCCALQLTNYDLYQGFDVSFDDQSLTTDSDEKKAREGDDSKRNKGKERKSRKREREKRKIKIKKSIQKITKEVEKILDKVQKNGTKERKKKTKLLKRFIVALKKQYKDDRLTVKDLHEEQIMKIDKDLMTMLYQIKAMNDEFIRNQTFRDIIINGTMTKKGARMLVQAYPQLSAFVPTMRRNNDYEPIHLATEKPKYFNYDIEYGYLYY